VSRRLAIATSLVVASVVSLASAREGHAQATEPVPAQAPAQAPSPAQPTLGDPAPAETPEHAAAPASVEPAAPADGAASEATTTEPAPAPDAAPDATASRLATDEEEGEPRLSLPTEADRQAWRRPGFRLALGGAYGHLAGLYGAPSGRLIAAKLRAGLRLDEGWSLLASFEYAQAKQTGGLSGLRFLGTIDPTWHVTPSVAVAAGFGFGGIVEGRNTGRMDAAPLPADLETSYTFPDASPPIARCSGVGAAGLVRVEWGLVLGPRSQMQVALEASGQWTGCVHDTNRFEPDTGKAIVRKQWWPHAGATLTLGLAWR